MYVAYNPVVIYLATLFICLGLLIKALKDMCSTQIEEEAAARDHQESPLITPEVYIIPANLHVPSMTNHFDDCPPPYEISTTPPPSYEECVKDHLITVESISNCD